MSGIMYFGVIVIANVANIVTFLVRRRYYLYHVVPLTFDAFLQIPPVCFRMFVMPFV